mgnify:CR=1 FL=1
MTEQLTREKILALQPGRELDALVAEKIFGVNNPDARWSPSTDIAAAWEVVEKMSKTHFSEIAMTELEDGTWGWMARFILVLNEPYTVNGYRATAKTSPEAICKAALLAVIDHD